MSFKEFDLSEYIEALENFKKSNADIVMKHWGNIDNFDMFIQKIKDDEPELAKLAIKQFGSIEKYTEAMKYNLEHFSELMDKQLTTDTEKIGQQSDDLYAKLTADLSIDFSSDKIQNIVQEIMDFIQEHATSVSLGEAYWNSFLNTYSSEYVKAVTDAKHGKGASDYIVNAFRYYLENKGVKGN